MSEFRELYTLKSNIGLSKIIEDVRKKTEQEIISEFRKIGDRIVRKIRARYGRTSKGSEYLENLFKEEFKTLEERK